MKIKRRQWCTSCAVVMATAISREQAAQRGELDDGFIATEEVSVKMPRVAEDVAACRWCPCAQINLDDLFGVVPSAAGVGHEDGLIEAEERDGIR